MKKRFFELATAVLLAVVLTVAVFAAATQPSANVDVTASIQVRKGGTDATWSTSTNALSMSLVDMTGTVDYRCNLNTTIVKNAIKEWYQYGLALINDAAGDDAAIKDALAANFNLWPVTGSFTVTITYPAALNVPTKYTDVTDPEYVPMIGFNEDAKSLFEETSRTLNGNTLTIVIAIKDADVDGTAGIMEQALYDGVVNGTFLSELSFTVEGVTMTPFTSAQTTTGSMTGATSFEIGQSSTDSDRVFFSTNEARATLLAPQAGDSSASSTTNDYKVTFNVNGKTGEIDPMYVMGIVKSVTLPKPKKDGFDFDGWYLDSAMTQKVTGNITIKDDIVLYGRFESKSFDTENHFAYVIGYEDGTVRAENNITRAEVAMIFYRLLRDDVRDKFFTTKNDFSDVNEGDWFNNAVSTMVNGGFILGYPDGTFAPNKSITRAEFATIAARTASLFDDAGASFSDIDGHWSEYYVLKAATAGWITGYPDGTFVPAKNITRAEAFTIINRVLGRSVDKAGIHKNATFWTDLKDEWYYCDVMEATNSHDHVRNTDGLTEIWTEITPNKTWR